MTLISTALLSQAASEVVFHSDSSILLQGLSMMTIPTTDQFTSLSGVLGTSEN